MQKYLRACAAIFVSLFASAAIAFAPLSLTPKDVEVPQRAVDVDPTSLETGAADLYRAITEASQYLSADLPNASAENQPDRGALTLNPAATDSPDDLAAALTYLALRANGSDRGNAGRSPSLPTGLAISDGQPVGGRGVSTPLDAIASADPEAPPMVAGLTIDTADTSNVHGISELEPSTGSLTEPQRSEAAEDESASANDATHDGGPDSTGSTNDQGTRAALVSEATGTTDRKITRAERQSLRPFRVGARVAAADAAETPGDSQTDRTPAAPMQERTAPSLRDVRQTVKKAIDGLRPRKTQANTGE